MIERGELTIKIPKRAKQEFPEVECSKVAERAVLEEFRKLASLKLFVITHRLSTIATADRVVVLDHGRVVEVGTHADLMTKEGTYARIIGVPHDVLA